VSEHVIRTLEHCNRSFGSIQLPTDRIEHSRAIVCMISIAQVTFNQFERYHPGNACIQCTDLTDDSDATFTGFAASHLTLDGEVDFGRYRRAQGSTSQASKCDQNRPPLTLNSFRVIPMRMRSTSPRSDAYWPHSAYRVANSNPPQKARRPNCLTPKETPGKRETRVSMHVNDHPEHVRMACRRVLRLYDVACEHARNAAACSRVVVCMKETSDAERAAAVGHLCT
jgi:hypothetical protein